MICLYREVRKGVRWDTRGKAVGEEMRICPNEILTMVRLVLYVREVPFELEVPVGCDLSAV